MRGGAIFLVFFIVFTLATLAVPVPLFPGNMVRSVYEALSIPVALHTPLLDALANGMLYGFIVWVVFILVSKKLEEPEFENKPRKGKRPRREPNLSQP